MNNMMIIDSFINIFLFDIKNIINDRVRRNRIIIERVICSF